MVPVIFKYVTTDSILAILQGTRFSVHFRVSHCEFHSQLKVFCDKGFGFPRFPMSGSM